jgi:superfamily II DNA or RNA helicase
MQIKVTSQIEINPCELPQDLLQQIKGELTISNPKYTQAERLGYYTGNIPRFIKLYRCEKNNLIIPRGYGRRLVELTQILKPTWENRQLSLPPIHINSRIQLRSYQESAVDALMRSRQGGVVAPCGSGKTIILLEAIARAKQPALWICHTKELLNQTKERACQVLDISDEEIGVIAEGKISIGNRLTIALVQTLSRIEINEIADRFGTVVIDEAHHLAAESFFYAVGMFSARYRFWVSATPERDDGLTQMIFVAGGPILHSVDRDSIPTIKPQLQVIETQFDYHHENYTKIISSLIADQKRNQTIVDTIAREASGNYSLVLSERTEHLNTLQGMLQKALPDMRIELLTGKMTDKQRKSAMERVKNKEIDILLATQLAREGLDVVHLNRLFLTVPKKALGATEQEVGRIMRPAPDKTDAVVFDFWDKQSPILKAQFWKRRQVYLKLGIQFNKSIFKVG